MAIALHRLSLRVAVVAVTFVVVFFAARAIDGPQNDLAAPLSFGSREGMLPTATTEQRIEALQAQMRSAPSADSYATRSASGPSLER
jgi:hypothetical protein